MASQRAERYRKLTWILGGTSVLLAIALIAVLGMSVGGQRDTGDDVREAAATESDHADVSGGAPAGVADMGPVSVITDDPTCAEWTRIGSALLEVQNRVLWFERDGSIPAVEWLPEQVDMYTTVARAMGSVAAQVGILARDTPHRAMREIYEQLAVHAREVINRIPQYQASDIHLFRAADTLVGAASSICAAARSGAAQARAPLTPPAAPPTAPSPAAPENNRTTLLADNPSICNEWVPLSTDYRNQIPDWVDDELYLGDITTPARIQFADASEEVSRRSNNAVAEDLAVLGAQYLRAYVAAVPTYGPADRALLDAADNLAKVVDHGCAGTV